MFTTKHAQVMFRVASPQTIRNWTKEFAGYLSPSATPGSGSTRRFSGEDMEILALIAELSSQGIGFEEIHASLASGQRGKLPNISPEDIDVLVAGEMERQLSTQLHETTELAQRLQGELDELKLQVQPLREENIRLKAQIEDRESRLDQLNQQLRDAQERIIQLAEEKGQAYVKGTMEALGRNRDQSKDNS
ncbi:MAG: MerR family transcriptional regulator [Chloroflexota bacterium]